MPTPDAILVLFCCEHPESGGSNSPKTYPMLNTAYFLQRRQPMDEFDASMALFCCEVAMLSTKYIFLQLYVPVRILCYGALWMDQDQARSLQRPPVQQYSPALSSVCPLLRTVLLLSCPVLAMLFRGNIEPGVQILFQPITADMRAAAGAYLIPPADPHKNRIT